MKRLSLPALLLPLALGLAVGAAGCRERQAAESPRVPPSAREQAETRAVQALAANLEEIRRRALGAEVDVPGTETRVRLVDGRAKGPGEPPAWNVELRGVAGVVRGERGLDVFVDLAIHRPLKAPDCYLALLYLDSVETVHSSSVAIGEGARVLTVEGESGRGEAYDLEVEYLGRAPQGNFVSNPTDRETRVLQVARHAFGSAAPRPAPHGV